MSTSTGRAAAWLGGAPDTAHGPLITAQDQKAKRIQTPKKEIQKGVDSGCNFSNPII